MFDNSSFGETIVTKYNLGTDIPLLKCLAFLHLNIKNNDSGYPHTTVCKDGMIGPISTACGWTGMGLLALVGGVASDRFGRKNLVGVVSWISALLYVLLYFTKSYLSYTIVWVVLTSIGIARYQAMMAYSVELTGIKYRFLFGMLPNIYYGLGYVSLTVIAYFTQSWSKGKKSIPGVF